MSCVRIEEVTPLEKLPRLVDRQARKVEPRRPEPGLVSQRMRRPLRARPDAAKGDTQHHNNLSEQNACHTPGRHGLLLLRHQLKGFLLRHDVRYTGKTSWCGAYYRWLGTLNFGAGAAQTAFTEYWQAVTAADDRVDRLTKALQAWITGWRFEPVVGALQALRGVAAITAIGLAAEIGDLGRFAHPRKLMGYLGLVPSEHSSGQRTSRGSITKTGNAHEHQQSCEVRALQPEHRRRAAQEDRMLATQSRP